MSLDFLTHSPLSSSLLLSLKFNFLLRLRSTHIVKKLIKLLGDKYQIPLKLNIAIFRSLQRGKCVIIGVQIIFAKSLCQFVSQLVPSSACYDGWGIVRPETMAGGTFLSLQTLHHDTSLRDIDYCYILSVTLMAFLRSHLDPRPLHCCIEPSNF